jgi:ProP effector
MTPDLNTEFARWFPGVFIAEAWKDHRPLAVGISVALRGACPLLTRDVIKQFMYGYTHRLRYLEACVVGAERIGLDGWPAGVVTESEAEYARQTLAEIYERRKQHAEAVKTARKAGRPDVKLNGKNLPDEPKNAAPPPQPMAKPARPLSLSGLKAAAAARRAEPW